MCHCEAPKGPWRPEREARGSALGVQSREGSHVDRTRHCRGADSRARRRTYSPYKPPSKWQTLPICHCEEANGRRGALSAKREEVPLGCNLAVPGRNVGKPSAKSQLPSRDCHVASLLAMTNPGALSRRIAAAMPAAASFPFGVGEHIVRKAALGGREGAVGRPSQIDAAEHAAAVQIE